MATNGCSMETAKQLMATFLGMLKLPSVLREVEQTAAVSTLKNLSLPRIIVMGDENAGKSSTLERIAMVDVLPRSHKICTRQPVALKLRHDEHVSSRSPRVVLRIPGEEPREGLASESVREVLEEHMNAIAAKQQGIVVGEEIEVEVHSDGVPTIDLVDLPGLVAVRVSEASEPEAIAKMTEACTRSYLEHELTGAVVCVLDATSDNLRTSKALRLVQDSREDLRRHTIGVLAKADKTYDRDWEDEGRSHGYWKLEARLRGVAEDYVPLNCGYFTVVNRNTKSLKNKDQSLQQHNVQEQGWFEEHMPGVSDDVRSRLGIASVVGQVDWVFNRFLGREYVPRRLQEQEARRVECEIRLLRLGKPPGDIPIPELLSYISDRLAAALGPSELNALCDAIVEKLPRTDTGCETRFQRVEQAKDTRKRHVALLEDRTLLNDLLSRVREVASDCFDSDVEGDMRLCRFVAIRDTVVQRAEDHLRSHAKAFISEASTTVEAILRVSRGQSIDGERLRSAIGDCVLEHLLMPAFVCLCSLDNLRDDIKGTPEEACADERAACVKEMPLINASVAALCRIRDC